MKKMLTIRRYEHTDEKAWNRLVASARNGTFLFQRAYMDYHADRFNDHSLMFVLDNQLLAIMPATEHGRQIRSHGGLTYGGLIFDHRMTTELVLQCFYCLCLYFNDLGFETLKYKPVPHIYHVKPAEEDLYAIFRCGGNLIARGPSAAIDLHNTEMPGKKQNGAKRGLRMGLTIRKLEDPTRLIRLIDENLQTRHGAQAVHTPQEMCILTSSFRNNIEVLELVDSNDQLLGGSIVYVTTKVAHTQYMVINDAGRPLRGMDVLIMYMMDRYSKICRYLDFGISSENDGLFLNTTLMAQKEGFAGSVICYDAYQIDLVNALILLKKSQELYCAR